MRPLLGGYYAWKDLGFPLVDVPERAEAATANYPLAANDSV